jgi:glycerol kinase
MPQDTVLAVDQGTTGTTVLLFDVTGRVLSRAYRQVTQYYPQAGWVEHDAGEILAGVAGAIGEVLAGAESLPKAIGIANQRETVVVWERDSGHPVHPAIVWQCRRTAPYCDRLRRRGVEEELTAKTGLLLDPYFSATKLAWLLAEVPGLARRAQAGELLAGTIDTWLTWHLTGRHATDCSNASRTMLFNIHRLDWDEELLALFGIPRCLLPEVVDTSGMVGLTRRVGGIPPGLPVSALVGDQQAALFGQACFRRGMAKNTYGTGAFILINTGEVAERPRAGLLTTVGWRKNGAVTYCLEGSVFIAGAAVQWLRDSLRIIASAAETEELALAVKDTGGVVFVPAFVGLGTPYWDPLARGTIVGITQGTRREHIVRACLEAIAHQSQDVLDCMAAQSVRPSMLRVDGGAARNGALLQMQANLSGLEVHRPAVVETTALGAAMLAGLAVGVWSGEAQLEQVWQADAQYRPTWGEAERLKARCMWERAVERSRFWAHPATQDPAAPRI